MIIHRKKNQKLAHLRALSKHFEQPARDYVHATCGIYFSEKKGGTNFSFGIAQCPPVLESPLWNDVLIDFN